MIMRTTQRKGDTAVAQAIATFTRCGYDVSLPLTESAPYDVVVDTGKMLYRVQVRYFSNKQVDLRQIHSNSNGYVIKKMKTKTYDWLYLLHQSGEEYLYKQCFIGRRALNPKGSNLIAKVLKPH